MASAVTRRDSFWDEVAKTRDDYSPQKRVTSQGVTLSDSAEEMRKEMFHACEEIDAFARRYFDHPPSKVLDLGAGKGTNTLLMARAGAHVTAIDLSKELLEDFSNQSVKVQCPVTNLRLRKGDITKLESYGEAFDLVVAVDILPYVPPMQLRSTMEKIHKCLKDQGTLIGTIFTTEVQLALRAMTGRLGAHYYRGGRKFIEQLLKCSGFKMIELEECAQMKGRWRFKAEKIAI